MGFCHEGGSARVSGLVSMTIRVLMRKASELFCGVPSAPRGCVCSLADVLQARATLLADRWTQLSFYLYMHAASFAFDV